jgi:hypothetical protein
MNRDDLITDIERIPYDRNGFGENLRELLRHAEFLRGISDVKDDLAAGILEVAPTYIGKQLKRLLVNLDEEPDFIAWISRNLMELFFTLRYMYSSRERYNEVITEQLKDLKELEELFCPGGTPNPDVPDEVKTFHAEMKALWDDVEEYGVKRDELERPYTVKHHAEGGDVLREYNQAWRIHSKYVHPTSYLLFGKTSFVFGEDVRRYFWVVAKYFAARNLRDLHLMVEAARAHS